MLEHESAVNKEFTLELEVVKLFRLLTHHMLHLEPPACGCMNVLELEFILYMH